MIIKMEKLKMEQQKIDVTKILSKILSDCMQRIIIEKKK